MSTNTDGRSELALVREGITVLSDLSRNFKELQKTLDGFDEDLRQGMEQHRQQLEATDGFMAKLRDTKGALRQLSSAADEYIRAVEQTGRNIQCQAQCKEKILSEVHAGQLDGELSSYRCILGQSFAYAAEKFQDFEEKRHRAEDLLCKLSNSGRSLRGGTQDTMDAAKDQDGISFAFAVGFTLITLGALAAVAWCAWPAAPAAAAAGEVVAGASSGTIAGQVVRGIGATVAGVIPWVHHRKVRSTRRLSELMHEEVIEVTQEVDLLLSQMGEITNTAEQSEQVLGAVKQIVEILGNKVQKDFYRAEHIVDDLQQLWASPLGIE